ncbi:E3 ubiquitin-protein ligase [Thecamonas trahens ATCC 50062]|uniref:HECT-type E3 ubiquitin transferase n=1 Tax=Thecamonas trahens ATCC 50062 TaxID=461836 RepID=A0A0L0DBL4_THETB|nr:E3 ubiquitin-protein ligase [Thecamonas trahens ATCC 50062]KNC49620.1 E3 ubiquitin-protein ligase [Thecamonas trahens ATCC 50062]|eukprot:XP_013757725.1 E3 ubiquitin-protein ligase [Thecamonas trahens ATCC 50062]
MARRPEPEQFLCPEYNAAHPSPGKEEVDEEEDEAEEAGLSLMERMATGEPLEIDLDTSPMLASLAPLLAPHEDDGAPEVVDPTPGSDSAAIVSRTVVLHRQEVKPEELSLTLESLRESLAAAAAAGEYTQLIRRLRQVFGSTSLLGAAFLAPGTDNANADEWGTVLDEVTAAYEALYAVDEPMVATAVRQAAEYLMIDQAVAAPMLRSHIELRQFVIVLLNPYLLDEDAANLLRKTALAVASLSDALKQVLVRWFAAWPRRHLSNLVATLQSFVLLRSVSVPSLNPHTDVPIISVVKILALTHAGNERRANAWREARLGELSDDAAPLPLTDFYNDTVNGHDFLDLVQDYETWINSSGGEFSFCAYPFLLDAATKADIVFLESELQMRQEGRRAMIQSILSGPVSPYLDTLNQLARYPNDMKKEMKVKFVGEEGVDEGGVRKEFFQVIVRELFDARFGMFAFDEETGSYYFNPASLEGEREFKLCGIVLGLAIYNKVIIDMHFPRVVYNRLCGLTPNLADLIDAMPAVGRNLKYIRDEFDGDYADLALFFEYEYDNFGQVVTVELCDGGSERAVTADNVAEYVDRYVRYVLVDAVEAQFGAFAEGFRSVVGSDAPHAAVSLFAPSELELLICGSEELDFTALEEVTRYEGFDDNDPTVRAFWEVVHEFDVEMKKKLLFFTTGSDRVPIKGLKALNFVVMRAGGDSDRLPTSHTCYNTILLPPYESKDKLRTLLIKALSNAEGFGML